MQKMLLRVVKIGQELLVNGVVAQEHTCSINQLVNLLITEGKTGGNLVDEQPQIWLNDILDIDLDQVGRDGPIGR